MSIEWTGHLPRIGHEVPNVLSSDSGTTSDPLRNHHGCISPQTLPIGEVRTNNQDFETYVAMNCVLSYT